MGSMGSTGSMGRLGSGGGDALGRFLVGPDALQASAAAMARTSCAATLRLQLALAEWLQQQAEEAVPPGSFDARRALYGTRPEQMQRKLDAVRYCAAQVGFDWRQAAGRELVAAWLLRELPECVAVPCERRESREAGVAAALPGGAAAAGGAPDGAAADPAAAPAAPSLPEDPDARLGATVVHETRWTLPNGDPVDCVVAVEEEKERIFDGTVLVRGTYDGQVSGASYEPGPWTWHERRGMWVRDAFPHDVLVVTQCGHCFSERMWNVVMSTSIERVSAHRFTARKAKCCAPLAGMQRICGQRLSEAQGFRVTGCRPRRPFYRRDEGGEGGAAAAPAAPTLAVPGAPPYVNVTGVAVHGSWGSRVDQTVRLLLALRARATMLGDPGAAKVILFSRQEAVLKLLAAACAMNGISAVQYGSKGGGGGGAHHELTAFLGRPSVQALLLSAQRDASGLTLTAASHVVIVEPQPDVATEQQMIGRVHRIGQTRQTHVHRIVVEGTFEPHVAAARLGERSLQVDPEAIDEEEDEDEVM